MMLGLLDLFEYRRVLGNTHAKEFLCPPIFVQHVVGVLPELLHVRPDKHLAELNEVTMFLVVNFNNTPGIHTSTDLSAVRSGNNPV